MLFITKKRMKYSWPHETNLLEIDQLFIDGQGWFKKEIIYDFLEKKPYSIKVKNQFGPYVVTGISKNGEKFVRSEPNTATFDNLLELPNG